MEKEHITTTVTEGTPEGKPIDSGDILTLIRTDILDRGEHFVYKRSKGRIAWEDSLPEGSAYSEAVLSKTDIEDSLGNAYRHATSMLTAMDLPVPVRVTIDSKEESGYTDGETVCVSTKMFDDRHLSMGQKLDIFTGLTVHEGCHVLYTDFVRKHLGDPALLHSIWNIVEDERIERRCGEDTPGLANFLAMAKYYFFGRMNAESMPESRPERLLNTILAYVRYPSAMQDGDILEFSDILLSVRDILTPYPESNKDARDAARKIYELIKDEVRKEPSGGDGKGEESKEGKAGGESSNGEDKDDKAKASSASSDKQDGRSDDAGRGDSLSDEDVEKILSGLAERAGKLTRASKHMDESEECSAVRADRKVARIAMGEIERCQAGDAYAVKSALRFDTRNRYNDSLSRIRHLIPATRRALICNAADRIQPLNGLRYGKLDASKLAEGFQGCDTIYSSRRVDRSEKLAVCVLVDESGSMYGDTIAMARDAAVLLNEALTGIPGIEYFLYGHTADTNGDGSVDITVYKEGKSNRFLAGNIEARANNADGYAILNVAERVRKRTDSRCLMIVLSDGEPACHAYKTYATGIRHTREAVSTVTSKGFIPIQVSILTDNDPSTMFDNYIKVDDLSSLPQTLAAIVKKTVTSSKRNAL